MNKSLVETRLDALYALSGEDLEGGYPLNRDVYQLALSILEEVSRIITCNTPYIYLNDDGTISAGWLIGNYIATIDIGKNKDYVELHYSPDIGKHTRKLVSINHAARHLAKLYPLKHNK